MRCENKGEKMKKALYISLTLICCLLMNTACNNEELPPKMQTVVVKPSPAPEHVNTLVTEPKDEVSLEGFYTVVSIEYNGEDLLEAHIQNGRNTDDYFYEFLSGGIVKQGFFPECCEDELLEGTFSINENIATIYLDIELVATIENDTIYIQPAEDIGVEGLRMVFKKNAKYTGPTFTRLCDFYMTIPSSGGEFTITEETIFYFTPEQTGVWEFRTSDKGNNSIFILLYDEYGDFLWMSGDGDNNRDARIIYYLYSWSEYTVITGYYSDNMDSYTLNVSRMDNIPELLSDGSSVQILKEELFTFIPNKSGKIEIQTFEKGDCDPIVRLYTGPDLYLLEEDYSSGENIFITYSVEQDTMYYILASFLSAAGDGYKLTATLK